MTQTLASAVIPVVAIFASLLTTAFTLRHQRKLAADQRLWDQRVALYVDLLGQDTPERFEDYDERFGQGASNEIGPGELTAEGRNISARVAALATKEVRQLWDQLVAAHAEVDFAWTMINSPEPSADEEHQLRDLDGKCQAARETLLKQIRQELGSGTG